MKFRNNKLVNFILEFSQIALVFLGVYSAIMCSATSLELTYSRPVLVISFLIAAVLFYGLFTVLETFPKGKLYGLIGITLFALLIMWRFFGVVEKGATNMINSFLKAFMNYSGSRLRLLSYVWEGSVDLYFTQKFCNTLVLIMLGVYLTAWISAFFYRKRRSIVFLAATVPFAVLPLFVGKLGYYSNVLTYLIVAVSILGTRHMRTNASDRRLRQKLSLLLLVFGLLAGGISYAFIPPQRYENNSGRIEQARNSIISLSQWSSSDVIAWVKAYFSDDAIDYGQIGKKREITYTGQTVLKISGDVSENYGMYLKGYVGDKYKNNKWSSYNSEEYKSDLAPLQTMGIDPDSWHLKLRNMIGDLRVMENSTPYSTWTTGTLRIRNIAFGYGNYLIPYLPDTSFKATANGHSALDNVGIDYSVEYYLVYPQVLRTTLLEGSHNLAYQEFWQNYLNPERKQLKEFVDKYYLQVPDSVKDSCDNFKKYLNDNGGLYDKYQKGHVDASKIYAAVKQYLWDNTEYSLSPGKTPAGEDTINYFLNESKKGYCTYYATTAAMLLRSVGIPTRYVEGVYVGKDRVKESADNEKEVDVLDSDAHAWVEVFDEYYGFVPLEVTPGRGEDDTTTDSSDSTGDTKNNNTSTTNESTETPEPSVTEEPETITPTPAVSEVPQEDMVFDDIDGNEDPSDTGTDGGSAKGRLVKTIVIVVVVLALVLILTEVQRRVRITLFNKYLQKVRIKDKIQLYHHHIAPMFVRRGVVFRRQTVTEYSLELQEVMELPAEDIATYVSYVFYARFGPDTIEEQQYQEFVTVYHEIRDKFYQDAKWLKKLYYRYVIVL